MDPDGPIWGEGQGSITLNDISRLRRLVPRLKHLASGPITPSQMSIGMYTFDKNEDEYDDHVLLYCIQTHILFY